MNAIKASSNTSPLFQDKMEQSSGVMKNVTYGVNYILSTVHSYVQSTKKTKRESRRAPWTPPRSTALSSSTGRSRPPSPDENSKRHVNRDQAVVINIGRERSGSEEQTTKEPEGSSSSSSIVLPSVGGPGKRSSLRDRTPREKPKDKTRVRYDMNSVPAVERNADFLAYHRRHAQSPSAAQDEAESKFSRRRAMPTRRCRDDMDNSSRPKCEQCQPRKSLLPFVEDTSVLWVPQKREEWEDCVHEMTAVCTSSAFRRHAASGATTPFFPPLSQAYIRDRIDIDDPLNGYQIRHKDGGWLQGFIMFTHFTTWTHYFKWDTLHKQSGFNVRKEVSAGRLVDHDGSLTAELEAQPRSGDPMAGGVVFPTIAEIGLLGGLGCGEYLLRMALDDIVQQGYKYVVLQATDGSKTFYERFGFVRVGAVSSYGIVDPSKQHKKFMLPKEHSDIVGYRHWTYANETKRNLDKHGGPSYMMALRLPVDDELPAATCSSCSQQPVSRQSFLADMRIIAVEDKPNITSLGDMCWAPASSKKSWMPAIPETKKAHHGLKRQHSRSSSSVSDTSVAKASATTHHRSKRRRTDSTSNLQSLMKPPARGDSMTFAQKQYQSPWLAVPPSPGDSTRRRPPRERVYDPNPVASARVQRRASGSSSSLRQSTGKRKPGRPPKSKTLVISVAVTGGIPRTPRPGRPRKLPPLLAQVPTGYEIIGKPRRGRPSHRARVAASAASLTTMPSTGRKKPGRPPKAAVALGRAVDNTSAGKKRGRPSKAVAQVRPDVSFRKKRKPGQSKQSAASVRTTPDSHHRTSPRLSAMAEQTSAAQPVEPSVALLDKTTLKQHGPGRIAKPNQLYLYNRIVKPVGAKKKNSGMAYFFVLEFDPDSPTMKIVPVARTGELGFSRQGRPRWQVAIESAAQDVQVSDYEEVPADIITKTRCISRESWDILE